MLRAGEYSIDHWRNLFTYLRSGCRQILYMAAASRVWIHARQIGSNPRERDPKLRETILVEEGEPPSELHLPECSIDYTAEGRRVNDADAAKCDGGTKGAKNRKNVRLCEWLLERPTAPLKLLYQNPEWTNRTIAFW